MKTAETPHRYLRRLALACAAFNLIAVLAFDLREWLVYFDPWLVRSAILPAFVVGLPALPFLIPLRTSTKASTSIWIWLSVTFLALLSFQTVWCGQLAIAHFFRGPDWNFYWPWEEHAPKVVALNKFNLSEYFWLRFLDQPLPKNPLLRELPGIAILVTYLIGLPLLVAGLRRQLAPDVTFARTLAYAVIFQVLSLCVWKIVLGGLINLKYIVADYDTLFNI